MSQLFKRFHLLFSLRNKEFYRDKAAMGWNFLFPVLVVVGFGYAFSGKDQALFKIALIGEDARSEVRALPSVEVVPIAAREEALSKLKRHQFDLVLEGNRYWVNSTAPKGKVVETLLRGALPEPASLERGSVEGKEIRYVDWLVCGLIGMNMMFSALFGVGYVIVRYRKTGVLRRFKATPLQPALFLISQVASRLVLIVVTSVIVFFGTHALIGFEIHGSVLSLFLVWALGGMSLIALGLLIAARVKSEEFAGGLLNLISWPMMFLSGVWFSLEGAHPVVKKIAYAVPLTHVIDASRKIMNEGQTLLQVMPEVTTLGLMTVALLALGAVLFRWE
jgi:ABC-type multidrug transport system permease subunit